MQFSPNYRITQTAHIAHTHTHTHTHTVIFLRMYIYIYTYRIQDGNCMYIYYIHIYIIYIHIYVCIEYKKGIHIHTHTHTHTHTLLVPSPSPIVPSGGNSPTTSAAVTTRLEFCLSNCLANPLHKCMHCRTTYPNGHECEGCPVELSVLFSRRRTSTHEDLEGLKIPTCPSSEWLCL
jgi:hypothetical protein